MLEWIEEQLQNTMRAIEGTLISDELVIPQQVDRTVTTLKRHRSSE